MIITHLLAYIVRDTSSKALQKMLEMTSSQLKTERCTLQDILANVFNRLLGISFSESLDTLYERLHGIWFFLINLTKYKDIPKRRLKTFARMS